MLQNFLTMSSLMHLLVHHVSHDMLQLLFGDALSHYAAAIFSPRYRVGHSKLLPGQHSIYLGRMKLSGGMPLTALCQAVRQRERVQVDCLTCRLCARRHVSQVQGGEEHNQGRDIVSRTAIGGRTESRASRLSQCNDDFPGAALRRYKRETRQMLEDEWRMLAMGEGSDRYHCRQQKADLEVYYTRDGSMFNDYHKSPNRNFYVDMT